MTHLNETALHGALVRAPELRTLDTGSVVVGFTLGLTLGGPDREYPLYVWCEAHGPQSDLLRLVDTAHQVMVSGPVSQNGERFTLRADRIHTAGPTPQESLTEDRSGGQRLNTGFAHSVVQGELIADPIQHDVGLELRIKSVDRIVLPDQRLLEVPHYVPLLLRGDLAANPPSMEVGDTILASGLPFRASSLQRTFVLTRALAVGIKGA